MSRTGDDLKLVLHILKENLTICFFLSVFSAGHRKSNEAKMKILKNYRVYVFRNGRIYVHTRVPGTFASNFGMQFVGRDRLNSPFAIFFSVSREFNFRSRVILLPIRAYSAVQ